ncbi:MAG: GntR family transcriptional regulator [Anaerolineales bacterium]|nr:GntR family transcriptional regulator [Anaerolineales bacterium]
MNKNRFPNIPVIPKRLLLREQVKTHIVNSVMTGEIKPGERLIESTLARQLGISQAPVREAIRDLVMMGFLETEPYKGATVQEFSHKDLHEMYAVRAALESLAAREAASHLTDKDLEKLREIYQAMLTAAQDDDIQKTSALNNDFHEYIIHVSGNKMINRLWHTLQLGHWTYYSARRSDLGLEALVERHEDLIKALETRNPQTAMNAMRRHIESVEPVSHLNN